MNDFTYVTTEAAVSTYNSATGVFNALLQEVRELSKKKPDATMSPSKVKLINAVLDDLLMVLHDDPESKYLRRLEDDELPQVSDALLMMAQFDAALDAFRKRYYRYVRINYLRKVFWITAEKVAEWEAQGEQIESGDEL